MNKLVWMLASLPLAAQDPRQIIEEVQKRSRAGSQRYEGTLEVSDAKRKIATKRWTFERLGSFGESKSLLRFVDPPEVKGIALLIHNHPDRASDQWMWRPAIERDQRIALQDRSTRFFGTDFSYEDLEERDVAQFDYRIDGEETLDGAACWRLESKPRKASQYTRSLLWIRKDDYTIRKVESFNKKGLMRRIAYRDFEKNANIWTAKTTEIHDVTRDSRTVLKLEKLQYNVAAPEENFTLQALRRKS